MEFLQELLTRSIDWLPFLGTLIGCILVFTFARHLLSVRFDATFSEHRILRYLVFISLFSIMVIILTVALPINETLRGQLLALTGLLASAVVALSSATFVGNAMAGLMLRTVRNFQIGDFLQVGEHLGRISEFGFLHTEIQTEERRLTTLPNLYFVTSPVTVVRSSGTIVSANVSLGYDHPRKKIEAALKRAAHQAKLEEPFVHIRELGDFSATYRISGFLSEVKKLISARSRLREKMLDCLHEDGIEIVSPTFMNRRNFTPQKQFIPQQSPRQRLEKPTKEGPESIIFDKAEEAESAEEIKEKIKSFEDELEILEKEKDKEANKDEMEEIKEKIALLKRLYKSASENLEG